MGKRRPRRARAGSGDCRKAVSDYVRAVRAFGAGVGDYRNKAGAQAAAEQRAARSALEWRDAAKRYEARASEKSPAQVRRSKALARGYQRAFYRFAAAEKKRKATRTSANAAQEKVEGEKGKKRPRATRRARLTRAGTGLEGETRGEEGYPLPS